MGSPLHEAARRHRTTSVFERHPAYPLAARIALADPTDPEALRAIGVRPDRTSGWIIGAAQWISGVPALRSPDSRRLFGLLDQADIRDTHDPLSISASLALARDPRCADAFERAAALIRGALSLHRATLSGSLPPDQVKGEPAEMGLYPNLFGTHIVLDDRGTHLQKTSELCCVAVLIRGSAFLLRLDDRAHPPSHGRLVAVLRQLADAPPGPSGPHSCRFAAATAGSIAAQKEALASMEASPEGRIALASMRKSLFAVSLDLDASPSSLAELLVAIHRGPVENRWGLSSLQLVTFANGEAGVICSFRAWLDGNTMMRGAAEIVRRSDQGTEPDVSQPPLEVSALRAAVDPGLLDRCRSESAATHDTENQQWVFEIDVAGSLTFRRLGLPPVPLFAVLVAVAVRRVAGHTPRMGQFLSMTQFRGIGVRLASVTTPELERFVEAWTDAGPTGVGLEALRQALESQVVSCRRARKALSVRDVFKLLRHSPRRRERIVSRVAERSAFWLLGRLGRFHPAPGHEVLLSHPAIFPEVRAVGRPGVRLDYVRYMAIHYQIFDDRIVLTLATGRDWRAPLSRFVGLLREETSSLIRTVQESNPPTE